MFCSQWSRTTTAATGVSRRACSHRPTQSAKPAWSRSKKRSSDSSLGLKKRFNKAPSTACHCAGVWSWPMVWPQSVMACSQSSKRLISAASKPPTPGVGTVSPQAWPKGSLWGSLPLAYPNNKRRRPKAQVLWSASARSGAMPHCCRCFASMPHRTPEACSQGVKVARSSLRRPNAWRMASTSNKACQSARLSRHCGHCINRSRA